MCWEMDYLFYAELEKAKKAEAAKEERAGVIKNLLNEANKEAERASVEPTPVNESATAK